MYDSPIEYCTVCKVYVALDQPQDECAVENQCGRGPGRCPLARFFASSASTTSVQVTAPASEGTPPAEIASQDQFVG